MKNSPLPALTTVTVIVLAAGHGNKDSGAVAGKNVERDEAIKIVDFAAAYLRTVLPPEAVVIAPHEHDTHETIPWLNLRYPALNTALAVEVHRDSTDTIKEPDASWRCGVYYGDSRASAQMGEYFANTLRGCGAHRTTWARPHRGSGHGSLMWLTKPKCWSLLFEMAFVEGTGGEAHLRKLAWMLAQSLLSGFSGQTLRVPPPDAPAAPAAPAAPVATKQPAAAA